MFYIQVLQRLWTEDCKSSHYWRGLDPFSRSTAILCCFCHSVGCKSACFIFLDWTRYSCKRHLPDHEFFLLICLLVLILADISFIRHGRKFCKSAYSLNHIIKIQINLHLFISILHSSDQWLLNFVLSGQYYHILYFLKLIFGGLLLS